MKGNEPFKSTVSGETNESSCLVVPVRKNETYNMNVFSRD